MKNNELKKILDQMKLSETNCPQNFEQWSELLNLVNCQFDEMDSRIKALESNLARSENQNRLLMTESRNLSMKEIEANNLQFKTLFDLSPLPYMFFGEIGIIDCNKASIQVLGGVEKSDILLKHPAEFSPEFQPDGRTSKEKSIEMDGLARKNGFHCFEWTHKTLQGKEFPVEVSMAAVPLGSQIAMLVIWRDLTESKIKDQMLLQSSKMSSLGEMAGGIAHEINNPIGIIQSLSSLLLKKMDSGAFTAEDGRLKIEKIIAMTHRVSKIIGGLKSFSRNAEKDPYSPVEVQLIFANVLSLCEEKIKSLNIRIEINCQTLLKLECRNTQIEQVLLNLISNSMDAVLELNEKWIRLEAQMQVDRLEISVTDSGGGIPRLVVQKLMQPFFTTKNVGKGTGLGLSISKGIIEDHGGNFYYDQNSKNTRFVVLLPLKQTPMESTIKAS